MKKLFFLAAALQVFALGASAQQKNFIKLIPNGAPTDFTYFGPYTGAYIVQAPGGYMLASSVRDSVTSNIMMIRLTEDCDTIYTNEVKIPIYYENTASLVRTHDGQYAMSATYNTYGTNYDDETMIAKVDSGGNKVFTSILTGSGICCWDLAQGNIVETLDHGFLLTGIDYGISDFGSYAIKTDSAGNDKFHMTLGGGSYVGCARQNGDSSYLVGGQYYSNNIAVLKKFDSAGNLTWYKDYDKGLGGSNSHTSVKVIKELANGYLLAVVYTNPATNRYNLWMIETNANHLDTIRTTTIPNQGDVYAMEATAHGYIVAGADSNKRTGYDFKLLMLDSSYHKISEHTYGTAGADMPYSLVKSPDGGYVMCGSYTPATGTGGVLLIKVDSLGCVSPKATFTSKRTTGLKYTFTNTSFLGITDSGYTYHWDFGDGATDSILSPQHTYASNGIYPVTLKITTACGTDSAELMLNTNITGIAPTANTWANSVTVYPSINNGTFFVQLPPDKDVTLSVTDALGRRIYNGKSKSQLEKIKLEHASPGIYFVSIEAEDGGVVKRVMVTNIAR